MKKSRQRKQRYSIGLPGIRKKSILLVLLATLSPFLKTNYLESHWRNWRNTIPIFLNGRLSRSPNFEISTSKEAID